jgi:adenosylcobyric acid synthase
MNPVLLKPETDTGAQVIVQGKRFGALRAIDYGTRKATLMPAVLDSFARLEAEADIIVVEGAGSPAEVNLRAGDIANMGFALAANVPVVMVGDIDRGGVIASLVGTHAVLEADERALIKGYLINKFRGDVRLFDGGLVAISAATGWPSFGVAPWFAEAHRLPAEDALDLSRRGKGAGRLVIAAPIIARIANFDDLDPLAQEPEVELRLVPPGEPLPADATLVILPGSKSTIGDLAFFRAQGWDIDLAAHVRRGGHVLGLCGGYQMLGRVIADPDGVEGPAGEAEGLGLLDVRTVLTADKVVRPVEARHLPSGEPVSGYEIHLGRTEGPHTARPLLSIAGQPDGAISADGRVQGSYVHGLFGSDSFRKAYLAGFGRRSALAYEATIEATLDALADHCERHLDVDALLAVARQR